MTTSEFLTWWGGQLNELIPDSMRGLWQRGRSTLTLRIRGQQVELIGSSGEAIGAFDVPRVDSSGVPPALSEDRVALPGSPQRLRVILEPGQYLVRQFTLPRAARPHLAEAVGYQLPKLTPFSADQVLYACGALPDTSPDAPLSVWIAVIPRQQLLPVLAMIGQSAPASPLPVTRLPEPNGPLEISWRLAETSRSPRNRMSIAWTGLAFLLVGVFALHLYKRHADYQELDDMLQSLRGEAAEVTQMRQQLTDATAQLDWIAQRKRTTTSALVLLDSLTQLLDDNTWLQRLDFNGNKLTLTGVSSASSTLIETLELSSTFEGVRFDAFTRDSRSEADRFNLNARIEQPAQEEGGT